MSKYRYCEECRAKLAAYERARRAGQPLPSKKRCAACTRMEYKRYQKPNRQKPAMREAIRAYQAAYYRRRKGKKAA